MEFRIKIRNERKPHLSKKALEQDGKVFNLVEAWTLKPEEHPGVKEGELGFLISDEKRPYPQSAPRIWASGDLQAV